MKLIDRLTGRSSELEKIAARINSNMENNYKDAAQDNLKEFEALYYELARNEKLNGKQKARYGAMLDDYRQKMKGFTHKDQTPFWT